VSWLTPIILATQEAEIRRIEVRNQLSKIVPDVLSKIPNTKKDWQNGLSARAPA
jgi:hypothetical protein